MEINLGMVSKNGYFNKREKLWKIIKKKLEKLGEKYEKLYVSVTWTKQLHQCYILHVQRLDELFRPEPLEVVPGVPSQILPVRHGVFHVRFAAPCQAEASVKYHIVEMLPKNVFVKLCPIIGRIGTVYAPFSAASASMVARKLSFCIFLKIHRIIY